MSATQAGDAMISVPVPCEIAGVDAHSLIVESIRGLADCLNTCMEVLSPQERQEIMFMACDGYCEG